VPILSRVILAGLTVMLVVASALKPRRRPPQRTQAPQLDEGALIAGDGARLPLASWEAAGSPRAVMLGLHGYGDYREAFRIAGPRFAAHGVTFYAYDQRGFGETEARGQWPGPEALIQDLADAVTALRERHPGLPIYVIGESMGGSVALAGLGGGEISGVDRLILAAPGVRGDIPLRQLHDVALRLGALAMPWLAVELRRGGRPWLEPSEAARLADDPLILRALGVGTYEGLIELADLASAEPVITLPPTLLLYGELDTTIPRPAIEDLAERLADVATLRLYPEHHHLMLHEITAEEVLDDCLAWLRLADDRRPRR